MKQWLCDSCGHNFIPAVVGQSFTFKLLPVNLGSRKCYPVDITSVTIKIDNICGMDICRHCLVEGIRIAE